MQFFFIRHAQSTNNALDARAGYNGKRSEDPPLTDLGIKQARELARFLANGDSKEISHCEGNGFGINILYCSLMIRSVQTGTILADKLGLHLAALEDIHECGGIYLEDEQTGVITCLPGQNNSYFQANYPQLELPENMVESGWWDSRSVETPEDCLRRAGRFLKLVRAHHKKDFDRVAIVSHGGFYNDLLAKIIGLPRRNSTWFSMYNTAITRIDFHENLIELVYQNRVDHLSCDLIT